MVRNKSFKYIITSPIFVSRMQASDWNQSISTMWHYLGYWYSFVFCFRWSISWLREKLVKAVVMASVQPSSKQGQECWVISFSFAHNAMESGIISCDANRWSDSLIFLHIHLMGWMWKGAKFCYEFLSFHKYAWWSDCTFSGLNHFHHQRLRH